ncbi:hypothetical protein VTO42DRAFT_5681 [Malbranchea cinnamomea]
MGPTLNAAPILSTPDTHILDATTPPQTVHPPDENLSEEELCVIYDIERTLKEIKEGRWQRIALQFPDEMLPDAPKVFQLLSRGLSAEQRGSATRRHSENWSRETANAGSTNNDRENETKKDLADPLADGLKIQEPSAASAPKLYILADTSYGSCCVDEVAAEHVNADVVVHYGRACLSPTSRLPVIHVFTHRQLDHAAVVEVLKESYPDKTEKIAVVADVIFSDHVDTIVSRLVDESYTNVFGTKVVHQPSSPIPNRTVPPSVLEDPETLKDWHVFHISDPPTALLLTLSSRVGSIRIYPTNQGRTTKPVVASTFAALRRRYAIVTSLSTAPVFGILVNTLSVKNYLHIVEHVQRQIAKAGKKSYLFVVGKLNAAKLANFSEIAGWVVIGCWESSLVESKDFWKPLITPFELELALQSDAERVWTGEWSSDFQPLLDKAKAAERNGECGRSGDLNGIEEPDISARVQVDENELSEPETAPPEFNLRTGRYVTDSRPMRATDTRSSSQIRGSKALAKRVKGDVATIAGVVSPGAEYLRTQRTWSGLGSDFTIEYEAGSADRERGTVVVEGRCGIARGYIVGDDTDQR